MSGSQEPLVEWTGERYVPWVDLGSPEIHYEHLGRYHFAMQFVEGKQVLDLASGEGYGCAILSEKAKHVVGIDLDENAVKHSTGKYPFPNADFLQGSITDVPIKDEKIFDIVTCFEAIEHIEDHDALLGEVRRLLKDDGIFIVSTPNKLLYTDQPEYNNPYHLKELYFDDFKGLIEKYFKYNYFFGQKVFPVSQIWSLGQEKGSCSEICIHKRDNNFVPLNHSDKMPLYFICVSSQEPIPDLSENRFFSLIDVSNDLAGSLRNMINQKDNDIRNLMEVIGKKDEMLGQKEELIRQKDEQLWQREKEREQKEKAINNMIETVKQKETAIKQKDQIINSLNKQIEQYLNSRSWRYTAPFRWVMKKKIILKDFIYRRLGFLIKDTYIYKAWKESKNTVDNIENRNDLSVEMDKDFYLYDLFKRAATKSPNYVEISEDNIELNEYDLKLIAFYLPQFHPIPENDKWWGKGFTEWTNVSKAVPQFYGHYQPHLPGELGFYDLRLVEVQKRQIELAKKYGIYGFCFYHYWFGGKKLLDTPLTQYLEHSELDFPFCICWANENWTRKWDGLDSEILISQSHSSKDYLEFIKDIENILKDSRYIRINGKPLLLVYRVELLPDAGAASACWREYCKNTGIGDIYLAAVQGFGFEDPQNYGFDAAVEFPPHTMRCADITGKIKFINREFCGKVYDYSDFVKSKTYLKTTPYKLFKTVSPSWDNTARKPNCPHIFYGSSPELYKEWLSDAANFTMKVNSEEEKIVFINAWNEWAEGTHLEPDRKYGYAYLQAAAEVVLNCRKKEKINKKIIFVSHDAHFHGAQLLSLNIVKVLKEKFKYEIFVLLKSGGMLESQFRKYADVFNLEKDYANKGDIENLIDRLYLQGIDAAICNTVISGDIVKVLKSRDIKVISLIHELPKLIKQYKAEKKAGYIAEFADKIVFPSNFVKEHFKEIIPLNNEKCVIAPQGLFKENTYKDKKGIARAKLRRELSFPEDSKIVLGIGYADYRKGIDIFVEAAQKVSRTANNIFFVWIGKRDEDAMNNMTLNIENLKKDNIVFLDIKQDLSLYYAGADIYLLTSREDPFPSVVLDAMNVGLPVIAFQNAGGFMDIVTNETGVLVTYLDVDEMSKKILELINNPAAVIRMGKNSMKLIEREFDFNDYIYKLLGLFGHEYKKVSIVIPNYNYAKHLQARLDCIFNQTYPIYEIIFLDDCSTDNSMEVFNEYIEKKNMSIKIKVNEVNSKSVFKQWNKGISMAKGDYVWIAEADDLCGNEFLEEVMAGFEENEVVLSYCQSKQMDPEGRIICDNYFNYTDDIDRDKWKCNYLRDGVKEISDTLAVKNTIPNVSAVVFKKHDVSGILSDLTGYKVAGDWFFYIWILQKGKIFYNSKPLNYHRRHDNSVTKSENKQLHYNEVLQIQDYVIKNFDIDKRTNEKIYEYRKSLKEYLLNQ